jgi:sugar-specific transcriptional regulator TrmB
MLMELRKTLIDLGLHKNEAEVYIALLELGITKTGPIIQATKLHRMLVYNALDSLIEQGLATELHKNNVKLFQALDPEALADHTKKLDTLARGIIPDLRKLQEDNQNIVNIRTLIGQEGFQTNLENMVESAGKQKNREMCIIGGAKDTAFYKAAGDWYESYIVLGESYKIKKRLLAPESYSGEFKKRFASENNTELKTSKGLSSPTYTRITEEMVAIEMYDPQIVIIQIRNPVIARGYLDSFELLWKNA